MGEQARPDTRPTIDRSKEEPMTRTTRLISLFAACFVLFAFCVGMGCSGTQRQAQSVAASSLAVAANRAYPKLQAAYRAEGDRAIDAAPTQAEARAALAVVRERWAPVWRAWDAVRLAQDAWATALESGASADDVARTVVALQAAYCGLRAATPGAALAEVPGFGCGP